MIFNTVSILNFENWNSIKSSTVAVLGKQRYRFNKLNFKTTGQLNSIAAGFL